MSDKIAIIGAGISGLSLALALHIKGLKATVYEEKAHPLVVGSALLFSPNGLRILDKLGLHLQMLENGNPLAGIVYQDPDNNVLDTYELGDKERYGYSGLRIFRHTLIDILYAEVKSKGVEVHFNHKFSHVVQESFSSVTWQFSNGTTATASILIGADGIYSKVRRHIHPDLNPSYIGMTAFAAAVPTSKVNLLPNQSDLTNCLTIISKSQGGIFIVPQQPDQSEIYFVKHKSMSGRSRTEWEEVMHDNEATTAFLKSNNEPFGDMVVDALNNLDPKTLLVWPFHVIPKLDRWFSRTNARVIILGDAAHAIPPSSAQGLNQSLEDIWLLSLILKRLGDEIVEEQQDKDEDKDKDKLTMKALLGFWEEYRRARVDKVIELNRIVNLRRMPKSDDSTTTATTAAATADTNSMTEQKTDWNLDWLYNVDLEADLDVWIKDQNKMRQSRY